MKVFTVRPKDMGKLVVVGGPGGSGASTIARMLAKQFGLHYVYAGMLMREYAKKNGYEEVSDFLQSEKFKKNPNAYDHLIDEKLVKFSNNPDVLIDSKVFAAIATNLMIPCSVKIWLDADIKIRVKRTLLKEGIITADSNVTKRSKVYKDVAEKLMQRYSNDKKRYQRLYGIDYDHPEKYNDIVMDTSAYNAGQTLNLLINRIKDGKYFD